MASPKHDDQHLGAHPLLNRLLEVGTSVRAFRGYVGPEKDSKRIRLYPSLGDLGFCIEINKNDIVASAAAPESLLPHGGTVIWVKPDAEVVATAIASIPSRRAARARQVPRLSMRRKRRALLSRFRRAGSTSACGRG